MAFVSHSSPITSSEDSQNSSETDLNINNTEDEIHRDTSNWTLAKRKKLQHMTESTKSINGYLVRRPLFILL